MSVETPIRPTAPVPQRGHVHDRSCWWDVLECRWAGPAHPAPRVTVRR